MRVSSLAAGVWVRGRLSGAEGKAPASRGGHAERAFPLGSGTASSERRVAGAGGTASRAPWEDSASALRSRK